LDEYMAENKGVSMLGIGQSFPEFRLKVVESSDPKSAMREVTRASYKDKWLVIFFYPKDFTFVCPTEIKGFGDLAAEFADRDAVVLGASTDSEFVHLAWRQHHPDLKDLPIGLISDIRRDLSSALGILDPTEGVAQRATFIVDPQGVIRFVYVTDLSVGRSPREVLRILDGLQSDELCPCNWEKGQPTLAVS
jgi:peroxiredoxin (alkyl hydroperoxide reductase subunit C)